MTYGSFSDGGPSRVCRADDLAASLPVFGAGDSDFVRVEIGIEAFHALVGHLTHAELDNLSSGFADWYRLTAFTPPRWFGVVRRRRDGTEYFAEQGVLK